MVARRAARISNYGVTEHLAQNMANGVVIKVITKITGLMSTVNEGV
jgi:hypothetical protein